MQEIKAHDTHGCSAEPWASVRTWIEPHSPGHPPSCCTIIPSASMPLACKTNMVAITHISAPQSPPPSQRLQREPAFPRKECIRGSGWWEPREGRGPSQEGLSQTFTKVRHWAEWTTGCPSLVLGRCGHICFRRSLS